MQLWDIAGQERYGHIARVYYKNSFGAILVYDVSRPVTFETVARWKEEIDNRVLLPNGKPIPVVLLGNKCDLDTAEIDTAQLDRYCQEKGFCGWFDTSAKLNLNIDKAARFLVECILEHSDLFPDEGGGGQSTETARTFTPGKIDMKQKGGGSDCC